MYKHLLVPIDGTPLTTPVVEQAVEFARDAAARTVSRYLTLAPILPGCGICLTFPIPSPAQRFPKRCRGSLQTRTGGLFGIKS